MPATAAVTLSLQTRAQLFSHLGAMEKAGVPVERALLSLSVPPRASAALGSLQKQIAGGSDMASAAHPSGSSASKESAR